MPAELYLQSPVSLVIFFTTLGFSIWGLLDEDFRYKHTLLPYDMVAYKEYWRLVTSGFMHGSWMHLAFNLLTLFFFSFVLERKLGSGALALIYGLGLLISQGATALRYLRDSGYEGSVGASGAISALVLSAILLQPHLNFGLPWLSERCPFLQVPAPVVGGIYLLYSLVSIFLPPRLQFQVNHMAHFSGALAGLLLTLLLRPAAWIGLQHYILASL